MDMEQSEVPRSAASIIAGNFESEAIAAVISFGLRPRAARSTEHGTRDIAKADPNAGAHRQTTQRTVVEIDG